MPQMVVDMTFLIPSWFYVFDSVMYFISSAVGLLLSFYFHRMYLISSEKKHLYVHFGFLLLSIGLIVMSITSLFSFAARNACGPSDNACASGLLGNLSSLEDFSYLIYFGFSIFAYLLFILVYAEEYLKSSKVFVVIFLSYLILLILFLPIKAGHGLWYSYNEYFHLTSFIMLLFVSFRSFLNYTELKRFNALLVAVSFSLISISHLFYLFSFVSGWMYVLGHISTLLGFAGFFILIMKVMKLSIKIKFFNQLLAKIILFEKSLLKGVAPEEKDKRHHQSSDLRVQCK